jgi:hypothetical protein
MHSSVGVGEGTIEIKENVKYNVMVPGFAITLSLTSVVSLSLRYGN